MAGQSPKSSGSSETARTGGSTLIDYAPTGPRAHPGHPALHPDTTPKHKDHATDDPNEAYTNDEAEREIRDWGGDAPTQLPVIPNRRRATSNAAKPSAGPRHSSTSSSAAPNRSDQPHQPPTYTRPGLGAQPSSSNAVDDRAGAPIRKRTRSGTVWSENGFPELTHVDTAFSDAHRAITRISRNRQSPDPTGLLSLRAKLTVRCTHRLAERASQQRLVQDPRWHRRWRGRRGRGGRGGGPGQPARPEQGRVGGRRPP